MVKLENIEKIYTTKLIKTQALSDINIEIKEGEFISVMGPSGKPSEQLQELLYFSS